MLYSSLVVALAAAAAPLATALEGCQSTFDGEFGINVQNVSSTPASKEKRQALEACKGTDIVLKDGILNDNHGRQGEVVINYQFQFDKPLQAHLSDSGFSVCPNMTLGLNSTIFYQCLSGDFYNLYSESLGKQCNEVYILVTPCTGNITDSPTGALSSSSTASETMSTSATASATPSATPSTMAPAVGSSAAAAPSAGVAAPSTNGTVKTSSPSATSTPEAFKGAASRLSAGSAALVLVLGLLGFAAL